MIALQSVKLQRNYMYHEVSYRLAAGIELMIFLQQGISMHGPLLHSNNNLDRSKRMKTKFAKNGHNCTLDTPDIVHDIPVN